MQFAFWTLLLLLFHSYFGYALLMNIIAFFKKKTLLALQQPIPQQVSIIVPAYNEALVIEEKIHNLLSLTQNGIAVEMLIVTDGSTDNSVELVANYNQVKLLHHTERKGKAAAINRAVEAASHDLVLITDANTVFNKEALLYLLPHFNYANTGAVTGEKRIVSKGVVGVSESLYWQYESFMKKTESHVHSVIAGAGELFCFRKFLYKPLNENSLIDDFMLSASILKQGHTILYEEKAIALEPPSQSLLQEANRKVRIGAGAAQAIKVLGFFPYKNLLLNYQYLSRRVTRWIVGPIALPALLLLSYFLYKELQLPFYGYFFYAQLAFYAIACIDFVLQLFKINLKLIAVPFYFVFMNVCMLAGILKYIFVGQSVNWSKAQR